MSVSNNSLVDRLFKIIEEKETNLCVAADFTTKKEILDLCLSIANHICMLKIHWRFIRDIDDEFWLTLVDLSKKYNFLIFEDSKYNEIGESLAIEYERIVPYVHIVTVADMDQGIYEQFRNVVNKFRESGLIGSNEPRGCLALLDMSTSDQSDPENTRDIGKAFQRVLKHRDIIVGIISQKVKIPTGDKNTLIKCTPGVHLTQTTDNKNQKYRTPEFVVEHLESDIIIVGRGISQDMSKAEQLAIEYKTRAYNAYKIRKNSIRFMTH